jgi:tRNA A37 methylthiotransferase MiaB
MYVFVLIYLYKCRSFIIYLKPWKGAVAACIYCIIRTMRNGLRKFSHKKTRALVIPKQGEYSVSQRLLQKFYKLNEEVSTCKSNHVVGRVFCVTPHLDQTLGWLKPNPATIDAEHKPCNLFAVLT